MRLKIEINTREHFSVLGTTRQSFTVDNPWFKGTTELPIYHLDELLGTKMRALYQRKKGRDLYDLWLGLRSDDADSNRIVECFSALHGSRWRDRLSRRARGESGREAS